MAIGAPKTRRSRRVVPIPNGLLARFKAKYQALLRDFPSEALKASYIFGDMHKGRPYEINSPNHALKRMVKRINKAQKEAEDKAGVKLPRLSPMRVHDLRHTYGSVMLSRKVPLELVSERLGHSSITITLNVYRHLLEEERQGHVFDVEELLRIPAPRAQA
jgi:integrase